MRKTDTRVQYTKARFHEAMAELLERMPCGSISVKALCEAAGLNRGTFYLHYSEPMDVVREMEWAMVERILGSLPNRETGMRESLTQFLEAIDRERRLCAVLIGHNGDPHLLHTISDRMYEMQRQQLIEQNPARSEAEVKAIYLFIFSGFTGMVTAWVNDETPLSREELVNLLVPLVKSFTNEP